MSESTNDIETPAEVLRDLFPDERPISALALRGALAILTDELEDLRAKVSELAARGE